MTVLLKIVLWIISGLESKYKGDKCDTQQGIYKKLSA